MADLTPIRPPNIPPDLWRQMSPEDQQQTRIEAFGPEAGPPIGGFAPSGPAPPPPGTPPPRETQATDPPQVVWAFVRSLNSFPGNHPYFDQDRAAGVGGYMLEAHDPYLAFGAEACRNAGFRVGVWEDPHGADGATFAADIVTAAHSVNADAIAPDPESTGKGYPGSPGWEWNRAAANGIQALDPNLPVAVTPTPNQDDFNYAAWVNTGAVVWVQAYGATLDQTFDPATVRDRVIANGVPPSKVTVILPAGSLAAGTKAANAIGLGYWAIYTIDDVTAGDRSVPFGEPSPGPSGEPPGGSDDGSQPDGSQPADGAPLSLDAYDGSENAPADDEIPLDLSELDYYEPGLPDTYQLVDRAQFVDPDDPPDSLGDTTAALGPLLRDPGERTLAGVSRFAASPGRGPAPPLSVVQAVNDDIRGHKVPVNVAFGMRAAMLVLEKGIPYVWGGTDPNRGLDCSGFARYVLRAAGVKSIARVTYDQAKQGRTVSPQHRQPLDLLFFEPTSRGPGHVAIYMAGGWAVHEPHTGQLAQWLDATSWRPLFTRRYLPDIHGYSPTTSVPVTSAQSAPAHLDDVAHGWHAFMTALDPDRHKAARGIRLISNEFAGIVK